MILLLATLLIALVSPTSSAITPASGAVKAIDAGEQNFDSLQACMQEENASLNIVYIIDKSDSMKTSDKDLARSSMVESTLRILTKAGANLGSGRVNYSFVGFGEGAETRDWVQLDENNLKPELDKVSGLARDNSDLGTDWRAGLLAAKNQIIKKQSSGDGQCFVALWMTDGQIDLNFGRGKSGFIEKTGEAFRDICESEGLINWFRDPNNNVSLMAALLSKNEALLSNNKTEPTSGSPDPSSLSMHEKSVLLFEAVVEGKSGLAIPQDVVDKFQLSSNTDDEGIYSCGKVLKDSNLGLLVKNGDAGDLSWEFVDLVAGITRMQKVIPESDEVFIPNAIGQIQIYAKGPEPRTLVLFDIDGNNVCELPGARCESSGAMENGTYTVFNVDIPKLGSQPGKWSILLEPRPKDYKVYVGLDGAFKQVKLQGSYTPSRDEYLEGSSINAQFDLVDIDGNLLTNDYFESVKICRTSPTPTGEDLKCPISSPAVFDFTVSESDKKVSAQAIVTVQGLKDPFKLDATKAITVNEGPQFAKFDCTVESPCSLKPIPNGSQRSQTKLDIKGGDKGTSTVKVVGFRAEDIPERADSYKVVGVPVGVSSNSKVSLPVEVAEGSIVPVEVYLSNLEIKSKDQGIQGYIIYEVVNGGEPITVEAPVTFSINQDKNWLAIILGYIIALLLAVGLPYLALLLQARRSAVFIDDEFKYIAVPVMVSKSGELLSKKDSRLEESFQNEVPDSANSNAGFEPFVAPSFKGLSGIIQIPKGAKSIQIDKATLKVEAARFDAFAPIKVSLSVPDSIVYSLLGKSANQLLKNESTADQSLSGLVFLYSNISAIEPTDRKSFVESQSSDDSFDSDGETMSFETNRAVSEEAFQGTLVIAIPGIKNEPVVLGKIATSLRSQSFETFNAELLALREQELAIEQESAAKQKAETEGNSGFAAGPGPNSSNSNKSENDDFDDSDTTHLSGNTNQSSSDDDDF